MVYGRHNGANQRWKVLYTDKVAKEATKGMDKDFGFQINKPFYIKSKMPMGRVMEAIGANNVTLKKWRANVKGQQFFFDRVSNTIKSQQWKNYSLNKSGNSLTVKTTNSKWF